MIYSRALSLFFLLLLLLLFFCGKFCFSLQSETREKLVVPLVVCILILFVILMHVEYMYTTYFSSHLCLPAVTTVAPVLMGTTGTGVSALQDLLARTAESVSFKPTVTSVLYEASHLKTSKYQFQLQVMSIILFSQVDTTF